jgi:hypothetical protein
MIALLSFVLASCAASLRVSDGKAVDFEDLAWLERAAQTAVADQRDILRGHEWSVGRVIVRADGEVLAMQQIAEGMAKGVLQSGGMVKAEPDPSAGRISATLSTAPGPTRDGLASRQYRLVIELVAADGSIQRILDPLLIEKRWPADQQRWK